MLNIDQIKPQIIERLKSFDPEKIILFGSYAYGKPTKDSDIDIMIIKKEPEEHIEAKALIKLKDLMKKYKVGFDVLCTTPEYLSKREDPFYKVDILQKGIKLYG